jgi:error-prone DNA polymerase
VLRETLGTIIFQDLVMQVAEAFAGFTPGEADGLRRAMSRKRSQEMLQRHRERFVEGAMRHSLADRQTSERVWGMVEGFAGFGFPKAHSAAFGLLAYQSTWLRVHYGAEFLCALLNEQPMGFYASDSLVHEAELRGIEMLGLDVNASELQCRVQDGAVRLGLSYVKGAAKEELEGLVAERERGGAYADLADLAGRATVSRRTLERLAWSGACDCLLAGQDRRTAFWQLGLTYSAQEAEDGESVQLALPLGLGETPRLRKLGRWQRLMADYATTGVTVGDHVLAALRGRLTAHKLATSAQLARLPDRCDVTVAGLVIARQKPGTANGTMFLLFEDEFGTINLVVPQAVYERHRHLARAEPLLLARGRLERTQETVPAQVWELGSGRPAPAEPRERIKPVVNVLVRELMALERFLPGDLDEGDAGASASVRRLRQPDGRPTEASEEGAEVGSSMRAVAPAVQSFAAGRRR